MHIVLLWGKGFRDALKRTTLQIRYDCHQHRHQIITFAVSVLGNYTTPRLITAWFVVLGGRARVPTVVIQLRMDVLGQYVTDLL